MSAPPTVLVLDDGELEDIHRLLQEIDVPCARVRGSAIVQGTPAPKDLLIATPRRIDAVAATIADAVSPPIRVMVVQEDSNALRAQLRRSGFDYLVRRPVHADALRLLLMHCLYKGEERRREPRVAAGFEIAYRTGLLTRRATLLDLSVHGCRLRSKTRAEPGKRIKLQIPEALDAGDPLSVAGRIVRSDAIPAGDAFALGVAFGQLDTSTRQALEILIEDLAHGPATLRGGVQGVPVGRERPEPPPELPPAAIAPQQPAPPPRRAAEPAAEQTRAPAPTAGAAEPTGRERRAHRRASYAQTIPAFGNRALRVLVGRDLSVAGMRIESQPELELGDRLHLAIYGEAGQEPMLVWGQVHRDDGQRGHVILFDPLDASIAARLEAMVASLPAVESLHDSESQAMGTVLTEIVDRGRADG